MERGADLWGDAVLRNAAPICQWRRSSS